MAGRYASATSVSSEQSRMEIERTLRRYGADEFAYWAKGELVIYAFRLKSRRVKLEIPLPSFDSFALTPETHKLRTPSSHEAAYEQGVRQRWRAISLLIKAKLEACEAGISTIEDEFLAHTMLPSGETVSEWLKPQWKALEAGDSLPLLPVGRG